MNGPVLLLGAGGTKSVKGPMKDEILPAILAEKSRIAGSDPKGRVARLVEFLQNEFHVTPELPKEQYPGLPLLMVARHGSRLPGAFPRGTGREHAREAS
jgi:hypothetical protein